MTWILQTLGIILIGTAAVDIFLTVLYARIGAGLLSPRFCKSGWHVFKWAARLLPSRRDRILSLAGPLIFVTIAAAWYLLFIFGYALLYYAQAPAVLESSTPSSPHSFAACLYFSGMNFTTLGTGDIFAQTNFWRIITVTEAITGFSTLTLTLTYLLSVYNALVRRNTFALFLHVKSAATGNPVVLLTKLGLCDGFNQAGSETTELTRHLIYLLESHHTYPVLHYFRFQEPYYALARILLVLLDMVSLAIAGLDQVKYHHFLESTAVTQVWEGAMLLLNQLSKTFLPEKYAAPYRDLTDRERHRWRQEFDEALDRFSRAGIAVRADRETGFQTYAACRGQWYPLVRGFSDFMAYDWQTIRSLKQPESA